MKKKISALVLAVLMIVAIVPMALIPASAEEIVFADAFTADIANGATVTNGVLATGSKTNSYYQKTFYLDGSGDVTVSFKMTPSFGYAGAGDFFLINDVPVLSTTEAKVVSVGGNTHTLTKVGKTLDQVPVTLVINPGTGIGTFTYGEEGYADYFVEKDVKFGCFEKTWNLGIKIGSSISNQSAARVTASGLLIKQYKDATTSAVSLLSSTANAAVDTTVTLDNSTQLIKVVAEGAAGKNTELLNADIVTINGTPVFSADATSVLYLCGTKTVARNNKTLKATFIINPVTGDVHGNWFDVQYPGNFNYSASFKIDPITDGKLSIKVPKGASVGYKTITAVSVEQWQEASSDIIVEASAEQNNYDPSDVFEVYAQVAGNKNLTSMDVTPVYNSEVFEIQSIENVADNGVFAGYSLTGEKATLTGGLGGNGQFIKYTVKVLETAVAGDYTFDLLLENIVGGSVVPSGKDIKVNAIDYSGAINFEGYQLYDDADSTYSIRFVVSGNIPKIGVFTNIGFRIETKNLAENMKWDITTSQAYRELSDSIITGAPTAEQLGKDYVSSLVLTGVPESEGEIEFEVTPYTYIDGAEFVGETKTAKIYMSDILFRNDYTDAEAKSGESRGTGVSVSGGVLSLAKNDADSVYTVSVDKVTGSDNMIRIKLDLAPVWDTVGEAGVADKVITVNGDTLYINKGVNEKSQRIFSVIGSSTGYTTQNGAFGDITIELDPATGEGSIFVHQSQYASRSDAQANFTLTGGAFDTVTLTFGNATAGFKIDNLLIEQVRK